MKKIFLYIISLAPLLSFSQTPGTFTIKGKAGNLNAPARAYLTYRLGANMVVDSAQIKNGSFDLSGGVINPTNAFLIIDYKGSGFNKLDSTADALSFYLDKGEFTISSPDSISKATITGSKINDENKQLMSELQPVIDHARLLEAQTKSASRARQNSVEFQNAMQAKYKALQAEQKTILKSFIMLHPDSYLSLLALTSVSGPAPDPTELDPLYNSLSQRLKETETAKVFKKALDGLRSTAIGSIAPDFVQNDVNGVPVR